MKRKFTVASNYDYTKEPGELNSQPSVTVPDQSMSIREIMDRFARGLPLDGERVPWYEGTDEEIQENGDFPDITRLDQVDRLMIAKEAKAHTEQLRMQLQEERKAAKKAKDEQREKSERTKAPKEDQGTKDAQPGPSNNPNPHKNPAGGNDEQTPPQKQ